MPKFCSLSSVYIPGIPQRYVMCALAFLGTMVGWMMYCNGFNTIQDIIAQSYEPLNKPTGYLKADRCYYIPPKPHTNVTGIYIRAYWTSNLRHGILQSMWFGYTVSSIISGIAADMFGSKHPWGLGILFTTVTAFLLPQSAGVSPYVVLVCLIFAGLGLGVMASCSSALVAQWAPANERTVYVAFIQIGIIVGLMLEFVLYSDGTIWENYLYASGISSIVWVLVWYVLFYNRPEQHPHISPRELHYIQTQIIGLRQSDPPRVNCKEFFPWKQILLSPPFMSLTMYYFSSCWVQSILIYHMQTYISEALDVPRLKIVPGTDMMGIILCVLFASILLNAWISDKLISTGFTTRTVNRRFFLIFPNFISVILILAIPLLECESSFVILVFSALFHAQGMAFAPLLANCVELSPRYAGLLQGILSAARGLAIIFCRQTKDVMVDSPDIYASWKWFFYLSAAIMVVFSSPYLCFGSGEIQTWNYHGQREIVESKPIPDRIETQIVPKDESTRTNSTTIPPK